MSGRHHSTRTPHRASEINRRDIFGVIARYRNANADARKVIYDGPNGKRFHWVTNPSSGDRYVVADGLGGATMSRGTVTAALSFSGQEGEVLIARPPAGFSGGLISRTTLPPINDPSRGPEPVGEDNFYIVAECYDSDSKNAYIARYHEHIEDAVTIYRALEVVKVAKGNLPYKEISEGEILSSVDLGAETQVGAYSMTYFNGAYILTYYVGDANTSFVHKFSASTGLEMAKLAYSFDNGSSAFSVPGNGSTCILGGDYYAVEPVLSSAHNSSGPPFSPNQRLVRRDYTTLTILNSYTIPSTAVKAPFAAVRYNEVQSIFAYSGGIRLFRMYLKQPTGGDDFRIWRQDFDASLTPGSDTVTAYHASTDAPQGMRAKLSLASGKIAYVRNADLYLGDWNDMTDTLVTAFNDDGTGDFFLEPLTSSKYLILGTGADFTTSILNSDGSQELP